MNKITRNSQGKKTKVGKGGKKRKKKRVVMNLRLASARKVSEQAQLCLNYNVLY